MLAITGYYKSMQVKQNMFCSDDDDDEHHLTMAKPDSRAEVLLEALSLALLR